MDQGKPKSGEYVALTWKKEDGSVWGATEGYVLGVIEGSDFQSYLVFDRSTYSNSLKSFFFSLGLLDLWLVPVSQVESIIELNQRERPPSLSEKMHLKMEIDYKSNFDYEETKVRLDKRGDCQLDVNQPSHTDGICNFTVRNIQLIKDVTIVFSPLGNIQIHCLPKQLSDCIKWIEESVEIQPGHKHLVLIPTNFMLNIHDQLKESSAPSKDVIDRLAQIEGDETIIFPLGWVDYFFAELEYNPLQDLFSDPHNLKEKVLIPNERKAANSKYVATSIESNRRIMLDLNFLNKHVSVSRYLSSEPQFMQIDGLILKPEEENGFKNMWIRSRFDKSLGFDSGKFGDFHGRVLIRNIVIDKKEGFYTTNMRKYYDSDL